MPDDEEVAIIKTFKKESPVEYRQLVKDVFQLLQAGEKLSELQQIRHRRVQALDEAILGKKKELLRLEEQTPRFDRYVNNNNKFFQNGGFLLVTVVGMLEVMTLLMTGIFTDPGTRYDPSCWESQ